MIEVANLSHAFGDHPVLSEVSFRVDKGEFVFLTGRSGAGKTTLLRLLHGDLPVKNAWVSVAGFEMGGLIRRNLSFLRRHVAVVFQDFKILDDHTVWENVALPLEVLGLSREQIARRVDAVITSLGLFRMANLNCASLSGGEKQRVAIARAMVGGPKVILADEPTGNLDQDTATRLLDVFKEFHAHGVTILMATHNRSFIKATPQARVLSLEGGRLRADTPSAFEQNAAPARQGNGL